MVTKPTPITQFRVPGYFQRQTNWNKWRVVYEGGEVFRTKYLSRLSKRESLEDYNTRLAQTPIPSFARAAVQEIRNSIYQPMIDVVRRDGSEAFTRAIQGLDLGIDRRGSSMNGFMGREVLEELLVMGVVGVFVDAPIVQNNATMADVGDFRPFLYTYKVEDILSYSTNNPEDPSEFSAVLLQDHIMQYDQATGLPDKLANRYRHLWIDPSDGLVRLQFYDADDNPVDRDGNISGPITLKLTRIPFVMMTIGQSLMADICEYQIALLNLVSSDVSYAIGANFPFYTEQSDTWKTGAHLKQGANPDGTATEGGQASHDKEIKVGTTQGRRYAKDHDRPGFIHPSSEPLRASMALQEKMESDIKKLVNLAVQTLASRESAESKSMDNRGLEAGLSYIGLLMEAAERQITEHWAAYENSTITQRKIATIKYPNRYSLKSDSDRINESEQLSKVITDTPSKTARKELWKSVCTTLLGGKVGPDTLDEIYGEIDKAKFTTSNPEVIIAAAEAGLVGEQLGSIALGFPKDEYLNARKDHAARAARIAETQGVGVNSQAAARGVKDLDANQSSGKDEKTESRDTTNQDSTKDRTRGKGKKT